MPVTVVEVSARDGLQAQAQALRPEIRAQWLRELLAAGLPEAEAGSFARPGLVPQMDETDRVLALLPDLLPRLWVLAPSLMGVRAALAAGARALVCLVSATESHSLANLGRPVAAVLEGLTAQRQEAERAGARVRLAVSMAFHDPAEGDVPPGRVASLAKRARVLGFPELTLCDTWGEAEPDQVARLLAQVLPAYPPETVGLHLHGRGGAALAGVEIALARGVARFDAAIGGLGGCPFAPGAAGNLDTEVLAAFLAAREAATGIDLDRLAGARRRCLALLRAAPPGDRGEPLAPPPAAR